VVASVRRILASFLGVRERGVVKKLLAIMAAAEAAVGIGLIVLPSRVASLLLGAALDTAVATTVARVAGVALLALGVACWRARDDTQSRAAAGIVSAMVIYNAGVGALLVYAALGLGLSSFALWPTAILHAGLAAWCAGSLAKAKPS
jgi:hypothetical protein